MIALTTAAAIGFAFSSLFHQEPYISFGRRVQDIERRWREVEATHARFQQLNFVIDQKAAECRARLADCEAIVKAWDARREAEKRQKDRP